MLEQKESYDVLRLIEHGQLRYTSSKCAGENPGQILKISSGNKKTGDIFIIKRDSRTTGVISQVQGNPCYQYVNPYSILKAEDGRIYFLDMQSEANRSKMIFMQRRDIRDIFLPPDEKVLSTCQ